MGEGRRQVSCSTDNHGASRPIPVSPGLGAVQMYCQRVPEVDRESTGSPDRTHRWLCQSLPLPSTSLHPKGQSSLGLAPLLKVRVVFPLLTKRAKDGVGWCLLLCVGHPRAYVSADPTPKCTQTEGTLWRACWGSSLHGPRAWRPRPPASQAPQWRDCVGRASPCRSWRSWEKGGRVGRVSSWLPCPLCPHPCDRQGHLSARSAEAWLWMMLGWAQVSP